MAESEAYNARSLISKDNLKNAKEKMESEIDLQVLRDCISLMFDHILQDLKLTHITIKPESNFYWEIPDENLYAVREVSPALDMGRLSDDWEFICEIAKDKNSAVSLMFIHVAPILRYLANQIGG